MQAGFLPSVRCIVTPMVSLGRGVKAIRAVLALMALGSAAWLVLDGDPNGLNVPPPCGEGGKQGWHQLADLGGRGRVARQEAPGVSFDRAGVDGLAKVSRYEGLNGAEPSLGITRQLDKARQHWRSLGRLKQRDGLILANHGWGGSFSRRRKYRCT